MKRSQVLSNLVDMIAAVDLHHPVRVGIDGVDASGKTMLADELAELLQNRGRSIIRISIDDFHNPREVRYVQGRHSPQGYYEDSFNLSVIIDHVLKPLGPQGNLQYRAVHFDLFTDSEIQSLSQTAPPDAILIFDGIFLQRTELRDYWDFVVFIQVDFDTTLKRALIRDRDHFESPEEILRIYRERYIPGQQIYLDDASPALKANVIWHNNDVENPKLIMNKRL